MINPLPRAHLSEKTRALGGRGIAMPIAERRRRKRRRRNIAMPIAGRRRIAMAIAWGRRRRRRRRRRKRSGGGSDGDRLTTTNDGDDRNSPRTPELEAMGARTAPSSSSRLV